MRTLTFICIGLASETDVIQLTSKDKQRYVLCVSRSCKQGEAISDPVKSSPLLVFQRIFSSNDLK